MSIHMSHIVCRSQWCDSAHRSTGAHVASCFISVWGKHYLTWTPGVSLTWSLITFAGYYKTKVCTCSSSPDVGKLLLTPTSQHFITSKKLSACMVTQHNTPSKGASCEVFQWHALLQIIIIIIRHTLDKIWWKVVTLNSPSQLSSWRELNKSSVNICRCCIKVSFFRQISSARSKNV